MVGVSVIIPCYNGEKYLHACIESALQQDYVGPVEILVGDDGSTDGSARIAESFGASAQVLRHPGGVNRGLPATRNLCIRASRHPFVALLDADDLWLPGHLTAMAGALTANPAAGLAYANGSFITSEGRKYGCQFVSNPPLDAKTLLLNCCLVPSGVVIRKDVFDKVGLFDENMRYCEDHDMWLRIAENYPIVFVPTDSYLYRQHPSQMTKSGDILWGYAKQVVNKAQARHPYAKSDIRKRNAVISYRLSEFEFRHQRYVRGAYHLGQAAWYDPTRAVGELVRRLQGRGTR
jgi:glycosyltransferase involved in cell wall biosynthesis